MRLGWSLPVLFVALVLYCLLLPEVWVSREQVRSEVQAGYIIPSQFSRILALGNKGILADFLFLKTATFIGGRGGAGQPLSEEDWHYVIRSLDVITDLDPYFSDPYTLAAGLLSWDAGKPEEANRLLKKGFHYRTFDWRLPFFIGFNYFYFLRDYETAADYIMTASQLPNSPAYLPTLGARLAYYGGKSKTALLFLQEMIADTDDALLRRRLELRLLALERAVIIEEALEHFKLRENRLPAPSELVELGYLPELPPDPYGGQWVLLPNGRVFSTSRFVVVDSNRDNAVEE